MARQFEEKLKMLYILKILADETYSDRRITTAELLKQLEGYGIKAERKSVYRDIDTLTEFGFDISKTRSGTCLYSRTFELAELKMLTDAIQASKFISERKSRDLIKKLEKLVSRPEAAELNRGVLVSERLKSDDASVIYTVDGLYSAMNQNRMISFHYMEWTPEKKKRPRHGGALYVLSPWRLLWDNENYYLLAYDSEFGGIKHFRVDKIADLTVLPDKRQGYEQYSRLDPGLYSKKVFGMFGGEDETVILEFPADMCGIIFDRFGTESTVFTQKDGTCSTAVHVQISDNFFGWIAGFGGKIRITSPARVRKRFISLLENNLSAYESAGKGQKQ